MSVASLAVGLAEPANDFQLNNDTVSPGLVGFAFFAALAVAVVLLVRSMNKQLRKINAPRAGELEEAERHKAENKPGNGR